MNNSRSEKLIKNTFWEAAGYVAYAITGFISRAVFVNRLGDTITGVATLFSSIINLLSVAELGFGSAITLHLYKPVAENNKKRIAALLNLYKQAYKVIALIVFCLGSLLLPFIQYFVKTDQDISNLKIYFFLYILKSVSSYCFAYKSVLITVNQEAYRVANVKNLILILMTVGQAVAIHFTNSYFLYLIIPIIGTLLTNIIILKNADKLYPYLEEYKNETVNMEEKKDIVNYIKATAIDRVSTSIKTATDNMIISAFVDVAVTGIVGNYNMLISTVTTFLGFFFNNSIPAFGNLTVSTDKEKQYKTMLDFELVTLWLYGFASAGILCVSTPFIRDIWIQKNNMVLPFSTLLLVVANFYLVGSKIPVSIFFSVKGYVKKIPYMNLLNVIININVSMGLVSSLGANGVYIGTVVSFILSSAWIMPYFVLKYNFDGIYAPYIKFYLYGNIVVLIAITCSIFTCGMITLSGITGIIIKVFLCTITFNSIFILGFIKTREFSSVFGLIKNIINRKLNKI